LPLVQPVLGLDECREHLDVPDRQVDEGGIQAPSTACRGDCARAYWGSPAAAFAVAISFGGFLALRIKV
jgi:hypothetical protein